MASRVLVAIPAWNEAATVAAVIREVRDHAPDCEIVVLDDGSQDETAEQAAAAGATVLTMPRHVGVGAAMRSAFRFARQHGYDRVVQVDADGQHDPKYIPDILQALDRSSVVIGARFADAADAPSYTVGGPRRWAMWTLARGLSQMTGARLTDVTSGFRGSDARAIALFSRHYPSEYLGDTLGSLVLAWRAGLSITQVPVAMRQRQGGEPSHGPLRTTVQLGRSLVSLASVLTRRPGGPDGTDTQ